MASRHDSLGPDGYVTRAGDPDHESQSLLSALLSAAKKDRNGCLTVAAGHPARKAILGADTSVRCDAFAACFKRLVWNSRASRAQFWYPLRELLIELRRQRLPLSPAHIELCFRAKKPDAEVFLNLISEADMVNLAERCAKAQPLSESCQAAVQKYRNLLNAHASNAGERKLVARLDALLGQAPATQIEPGEAWSDAALAYLQSLSPKQRSAWDKLLQQAAAHCPHRPTPEWLQAAAPLLKAVGHVAFKSQLVKWAVLVGKPGSKARRLGQTDAMDTTLIGDANADVFRGLVWCSPLTGDAALSRPLVQLAEVCFEMLPGRGMRSPKIGYACLYALGELPGAEPVAQLSRLQIRIKNRMILQKVDEALQTAARKAGVTVDELEEMTVPAFGLDEAGKRREALGDITAELTLDGASEASLNFSTKAGKPLKSTPAAVRKQFSQRLGELKADLKELRKTLSAQRERVEQLFRSQSSWPMPVWRERYFDHPLLSGMTKRLIWNLTRKTTTTAGIWHDRTFVDADGKKLEIGGNDCTVRLWHPIEADPQSVLAWRLWLERHEVVQPFKQAHRELYLLTDAERRTGTYSNRFAAHILKQHQFNALARQRGWKYKLLVMYDAGEPGRAVLELPAWNLRAEYWLAAASDEYADNTGAYFYLATDQVRLYRAGESEPMPLADVPPLVFSEIMRDVDLFVGVASVGNDPNWADGGRGGQYRDYWDSYAFGELSATAETRRALLERLVPRLKIAERCSLLDRFLVVRGSLHTYKIHLGSGNILMSPNDQYLCIVPDQPVAAVDRVHLPFEGDGVLSIILSKAFLLANDAEIADPAIASQVRG